MLFLQSKNAKSNCMGDYVSETHRCLATYSKVPKDYHECLTLATNTLEACALEELIVDTDALHKYDVDNTAYMSLKQVMAAQVEMRHLVNAADHTYVKWSKIDFGEPKAKTFKLYKEKFMANLKSIDLEVEITKRRLLIDKLAEKTSGAGECIAVCGFDQAKLTKQITEYHLELEKTTKLLGDSEATKNVLSGDVKELMKKLEDLRKELSECTSTMEELRNQVQTEVGSMKQEENLLLKLIKQRKVQPKTRLQKGWKISCWISRGNNGRGPNEQTYERFNFEKVKPDGEFVTKKGQFNRGFALRNHHEIKNFCAPSMKGLRRMNRRRFWNRRHYDGHETLIRVQGVFIAPKTGTLRFHTNTDDGSYLYLGDFRKHMVVNNGRLHGMRVRNGQMPAKKGEHLPFIFTFYEHHGHGAAYLTAKMGKTILKPYYYDNRLNKLMGLRKIKSRRVSKGKRVTFRRRK